MMKQLNNFELLFIKISVFPHRLRGTWSERPWARRSTSSHRWSSRIPSRTARPRSRRTTRSCTTTCRRPSETWKIRRISVPFPMFPTGDIGFHWSPLENHFNSNFFNDHWSSLLMVTIYFYPSRDYSCACYEGHLYELDRSRCWRVIVWMMEGSWRILMLLACFWAGCPL